MITFRLLPLPFLALWVALCAVIRFFVWLPKGDHAIVFIGWAALLFVIVGYPMILAGAPDVALMVAEWAVEAVFCESVQAFVAGIFLMAGLADVWRSIFASYPTGNVTDRAVRRGVSVCGLPNGF
jgi:hypothetical protein